MTKFLTLLAALSIVAAPAFAAEEKAAAPAAKEVAAAVDCSKAADKAACEKEQAAAKGAEKMGKEAPAAGEMKKEEGKKAH